MDKEKLKDMGVTAFNAVREFTIKEKAAEALSVANALPSRIKLAAAITVLGFAWHQTLHGNVKDLPNTPYFKVSVDDQGVVTGGKQKDERVKFTTLRNIYDPNSRTLTQAWGGSDNDGKPLPVNKEVVSFDDFTPRDQRGYEALKEQADKLTKFPALRGRLMH